MAQIRREIGLRVKELREIQGISAESLAKYLMVDRETYLAWEEGRDDFPVGVLYEIAGRFQVDLSELITGEAPKLRTYCLTRKGRGPEVYRRSSYRYWSLAANFQHRKAEPFLVEIPAESEQHPIALNSHPGQEFDYVLEGTMRITIGTHEMDLEAGDAVYFDSSEPHGMKALGGKAVRFLAVIL